MYYRSYRVGSVSKVVTAEPSAQVTRDYLHGAMEELYGPSATTDIIATTSVGKTVKIEPLESSESKPPIKGMSGMASSATPMIVQSDNLLMGMNYDGSADPSNHLALFNAMAEMKGITKEDELKRQFMLMFRGATLQWYNSVNRSQVSWDELKGAFLDRFQVLRDPRIFIQELMSARQMHGESVRDYEGRLNVLLSKLDAKTTIAVPLLIELFVQGLLLACLKTIQQHPLKEF
eukprot:Gb_05267 [translate_table: standard]